MAHNVARVAARRAVRLHSIGTTHSAQCNLGAKLAFPGCLPPLVQLGAPIGCPGRRHLQRLVLPRPARAPLSVVPAPAPTDRTHSSTTRAWRRGVDVLLEHGHHTLTLAAAVKKGLSRRYMSRPTQQLSSTTLGIALDPRFQRRLTGYGAAAREDGPGLFPTWTHPGRQSLVSTTDNQALATPHPN